MASKDEMCTRVHQIMYNMVKSLQFKISLRISKPIIVPTSASLQPSELLPSFCRICSSHSRVLVCSKSSFATFYFIKYFIFLLWTHQNASSRKCRKSAVFRSHRGCCRNKQVPINLNFKMGNNNNKNVPNKSFCESFLLPSCPSPGKFLTS